MQYWGRLARRTSTKSIQYNVVIDGLNNIALDDYDSIEAILSLFPVGNKCYKFLVTGDPYQILSEKAYNINYKDCFVDSFSLDQTIRYLEGCELDREDIEEIHKFTKGVPSKLASVRRLIKRAHRNLKLSIAQIIL